MILNSELVRSLPIGMQINPFSPTYQARFYPIFLSSVLEILLKISIEAKGYGIHEKLYILVNTVMDEQML